MADEYAYEFNGGEEIGEIEDVLSPQIEKLYDLLQLASADDVSINNLLNLDMVRESEATEYDYTEEKEEFPEPETTLEQQEEENFVSTKLEENEALSEINRTNTDLDSDIVMQMRQMEAIEHPEIPNHEFGSFEHPDVHVDIERLEVDETPDVEIERLSADVTNVQKVHIAPFEGLDGPQVSIREFDFAEAPNVDIRELESTEISPVTIEDITQHPETNVDIAEYEPAEVVRFEEKQIVDSEYTPVEIADLDIEPISPIDIHAEMPLVDNVFRPLDIETIEGQQWQPIESTDIEMPHVDIQQFTEAPEARVEIVDELPTMGNEWSPMPLELADTQPVEVVPFEPPEFSMGDYNVEPPVGEYNWQDLSKDFAVPESRPIKIADIAEIATPDYSPFAAPDNITAEPFSPLEMEAMEPLIYKPVEEYPTETIPRIEPVDMSVSVLTWEPVAEVPTPESAPVKIIYSPDDPFANFVDVPDEMVILPYSRDVHTQSADLHPPSSFQGIRLVNKPTQLNYQREI